MPVTPLRTQARLLMWLVTIPLAGFALLVAAVLGNLIWQGGRFADAVAIFYPPILLYMGAIWSLRAALKALAGGATFDAIVPRLMAQSGAALFAGATFSVFAVPLLTYVRDGRPYFQTFDGSAVTLGIVGAMLVPVARLLAEARAMREELDAFI